MDLFGILSRQLNPDGKFGSMTTWRTRQMRQSRKYYMNPDSASNISWKQKTICNFLRQLSQEILETSMDFCWEIFNQILDVWRYKWNIVNYWWYYLLTFQTILTKIPRLQWMNSSLAMISENDREMFGEIHCNLLKKSRQISDRQTWAILFIISIARFLTGFQ